VLSFGGFARVRACWLKISPCVNRWPCSSDHAVALGLQPPTSCSGSSIIVSGRSTRPHRSCVRSGRKRIVRDHEAEFAEDLAISYGRPSSREDCQAACVQNSWIRRYRDQGRRSCRQAHGRSAPPESARRRQPYLYSHSQACH